MGAEKKLPSLERTKDVGKKQKKNQPQHSLFLREVAMIAEVHCIFSHFLATSQKRVSSAAPVILCQLDHKWLEWPKTWLKQQGFQ